MAYEIVFKAGIKKDLKQLNRSDQSRILLSIVDKLGTHPEMEEMLSGRYKGLRRLRVGDYRILYEVIGRTVFILRIANRKDAYD